MSDTTEDEQLKAFVKSQAVWDAYKKYLSLDDMTMVEFAEIVYPLITQAKKDLLAEVRDKMPEEYDDYYATDPVRKGHKMGYNEAIHDTLAAIKEIEEGL